MTFAPPAAGYYPPHLDPGHAIPAADRGRPWFITALGVVSLTVAGFSILASLFSGCSSFMAATLSQRAVVLSQLSAARATTAPAISAIPQTPNGLATNDRIAVRNLVQSKLPRLSAQRLSHLDALLATHGKQIFTAVRPLSASVLSQCIGEAGEEYASAGAEAPEFVLVSAGPAVRRAGRMVLYDDHAEFRPGDGKTSLRASAPLSPSPAGPRSASRSTATQPAATGPTPALQPATIQPNHSLILGLNSIMSMLLAGLLIAAGILTLRQSSRARKALLLYVMLRFLASAAAILFLIWLMRLLNTPTENGARLVIFSGRLERILELILATSAAELVYPLVLLVVLFSSRKLKEYYGSA